jgi:ATP-dependent RNA helicase RhlE
VALSLLCPEEQPLLKAIEKLLKYAIPRQTLEEFPQVAVVRWVQAKTGKAANPPSKSKKRPAQAKVKPVKASPPATKSTKATPARRKKAAEECPAPKIGRRGQRSKR